MKKIIEEISAFLLPFREGQSVQWAAFLGAVAIAAALTVPPVLDNAARTRDDLTAPARQLIDQNMRGYEFDLYCVLQEIEELEKKQDLPPATSE